MEQAIPIFAFHRVGPRADCRFTVPTEVFEQYLSVVREEGYITLTCSELAEIVLGRIPAPSRACLLTFDDGCADVWVYATPLLRRHRLSATAFVVLNRLESTRRTRPTLDDVWSGRCGLADLYQLPELRHINARALEPTYQPSVDHISVEEAQAMAADGVCEIQCHGLDHMVHYTSDRLTGFLKPGSHWTAVAAAHGDARLGTPIYETGSVLVGPRYCDPRPIRDRLARVVRDYGGASFFDQRNWSATLKEEFDLATSEVASGTFEPEAKWNTLTLATLQRCIRELSEWTGRAVQTLAWPFGSYSERSQAIALQAGFAVALTSAGGGYAAGIPPGCVGRISLKTHDAEVFRSALLRFSDAEYLRQQVPSRPNDGPLSIAV